MYPGGLHRDRILPAIKLIADRMDILNVDIGVDYRRFTFERMRMYLTPNTAQTTAELQASFTRLSDTAPQKPVLTIGNRNIKAIALSGSVAWFDFVTLCGGPRSQNDYLDLASRFHTIILSDVPRLGARQFSEARRFTWLVDVLYDHKVKLIMSAECEPDELYEQGPMANEFHRTVSRIMEMQSNEYIESERRAAVTL